MTVIGYFITTWDYDGFATTCCYPRNQWLELIADFKASGRKFEAWKEPVGELWP